MGNYFFSLIILIGLLLSVQGDELTNSIGFDGIFDDFDELDKGFVVGGLDSDSASKLNNLCVGLLFNAIPHPSDKNLFIGCIEGKGTIFGCDENLIFDPISIKCVDPKLSTESSTSTKITTISTVFTTKPQTTTPARGENINISFSCPSSGVGLIPHKTDCTKYYECKRGLANPKSCSIDGYYYDVATKECQPADVAICANMIRCS